MPDGKSKVQLQRPHRDVHVDDGEAIGIVMLSLVRQPGWWVAWVAWVAWLSIHTI